MPASKGSKEGKREKRERRVEMNEGLERSVPERLGNREGKKKRNDGRTVSRGDIHTYTGRKIDIH